MGVRATYPGRFSSRKAAYPRVPIYGLGLPLLAMLYGPWRIFNEALRGDGERGTVLDGLLTNGQATSLILMAIGVLGGLFLYRNGEKVDRAKA